mgnify:CR=1 FL=1
MRRFRRSVVPTIGFQFTVLLSVFALIPTVVICLLVYRINDSQSSSASIQTADKAISAVADEISSVMQSAENTAAVLSKDSTLQMAHTGFSGEISLSTAIDYYIRLNRLFTYLNLNSSFYNIRVYLPDYYPITSEGYSIFSMSQLNTDQLPVAMRTKNQGYGWFGPYEITRFQEKETVITYYHTLFSYTKLSRSNSLICIDLSERALKDIFRRDVSIHANYQLCDSDGNIVFTNDPGLETEIGAFEQSKQDNGKNEAVLLKIPELGTCVARQIPLENSGWSIHGLVPLNQFGKSSTIIYSVILVFLGCLCLIPFASYHIVSVLVKGIRALTRNCEKVKSGRYELVPEDGTTREIRLLQSTHNSMVEKIDNLIHDVYEVSLAKQEVEKEFLYEQIKPHFLYNTLESAKWLALKEGAPSVANYIETLSKYFSLTLNKGNDWIELRREMERIEAYIHIMNLRFTDRIHYHIHMTEDTKCLPILKSILQPFVENAIIHGIHEKEDFTGTITIFAEASETDIMITIEDDGTGMDEETRDRLNNGQSVGYGITNVRRRLHLFYKEKYSIKFSGNDRSGTTVRLVLPKVDKTISQAKISGASGSYHTDH